MKIYIRQNPFRRFLGRIGLSGLLLLLLLFFIGSFITIDYHHKNYVDATVTSITTKQNITSYDGSVTTSYEYLVSTDKGVFHIRPDGLTASKYFGRLEEGKKYSFMTRGYTIPFFGFYPSIITANRIE